MSPVFRHGRLRLYLLKLLDESPRHGYEVIRLLQDRFLGVYAPSPGTIYPRLARLEEDGLVTHEEVDGKKVYSITDKGREEIRNRFSDLADLEDELTESLRDVAREISEDVRDTVRGIREELTAAAREFRNQHSEQTAASPPHPSEGASSDGTADDASAGTGTKAGAGSPDDTFAADEARRIREEAKRAREEMRARFRARNRGQRDWSAWQERLGRPDWTGWTAWTDWMGPGSTGQPGPSGGPGGHRGAGGPGPFGDLERMAIQFANELRSAARQAGDLGERSLNDLRDILTDTLAKVRVEVFTEADSNTPETGDAEQEERPADAGPTDAD